MKLNITNIILTLLLLLLLSSCAPDPRDVADANRTTVMAAQDAADRVQARAQADQIFQQTQTERQATDQSRTQALNRLYQWGGVALAVAVCMALIGIGGGISWAGISAGRAAARMTEIRASLIPLEKSGQYPLIMNYLGHGRFSLANPNTESVVMLDTRNRSDRQLIASSGAVELAGVLAEAARKSQDPASVAMIQPAVIGAEVLLRNEEGDNDEADQ